MWIGDLLADAWPPERPKFRAPLVLVHGLWSGSWCWQKWATHFCNLGWECWAMNFRGRFEQRPRAILKQLNFAACVEDVRRIIRSSPFPPVVVAHSLGGLVAQKAAEAEAISALVLLSCPPSRRLQPAAARSLRLLRLKYALLMALGRPFRLEEKDFHRLWFSALPEAQQVDLSRRMIPESVHLIRDFLARDIVLHSDRVRCPVLVLGGSEDPVVPVANLQGLAQSLSGDFNAYPGHGHWILGEGEGEVIARDIHRWLIQKLGEEILLVEFPEQE
ncbi:MAG: hypothetical protein A3C54_01065 [Deltaproteobacteria bacterium RIFCSPHIGHO2_02_FULL_60_17]|nr:MAG: hypothetical protein A3C54_01065 [Deltaproteobacteria bacterium RIFCSPHIGHO2_02_FULL_60_17]